MPGYMIANVTVTNPDGYRAYREQVPALVEKYGGRFLIRGGDVHVVEDDPGFDRLVVLEFASLEAARRFYESEDYAPLIKLRRENSISRVALVEGFDPPA